MKKKLSIFFSTLILINSKSHTTEQVDPISNIQNNQLINFKIDTLNKSETLSPCENNNLNNPVELNIDTEIGEYADSTETKRKSDWKYVFLVVHGTWAQNTPWWASDQPFAQQLLEGSKFIGKKMAESIGFKWSGELNHEDREAAAKELVKLIERFDSKTKIICVSHSHGTNIVNMASQILREKELKQASQRPHSLLPEAENPKHRYKIDTVYALATPVEMTKYYPDMNIIKRFYNFFSFKDGIQTVFGTYNRIYPKHHRISNIRIFLDDQEPSHTTIHPCLLSHWLPLVHKYLWKRNIGGFQNFQFGECAEVRVYKHKVPTYKLDPNIINIAEAEKHSRSEGTRSLMEIEKNYTDELKEKFEEEQQAEIPDIQTAVALKLYITKVCENKISTI
ncbi:MAG: hypothetical protein UR26_C0001G0012 [candidate division TM6 bacterium GW2011_GWF2_32_72]|nr:MAG: hypothetical protein UR26_C0001G0012 [candidate division TM6 bacterium GW2011_GWF2_32_72]